MVSAEERYWRQVPKVNVLESRRSIPQRSLIFRVILALVVVVGVYLVYAENANKADIDERIAENTEKFQELQGDLNLKNLSVDDLHGQINDEKGQRETINQVVQQIESSNIDWFTALESLFLAQTSGVIFESVSAENNTAALNVVGVALEDGSKASLPTRFSSLSETLDFQGIVWREGSNPPIFTATFRVGR